MQFHLSVIGMEELTAAIWWQGKCILASLEFSYLWLTEFFLKESERTLRTQNVFWHSGRLFLSQDKNHRNNTFCSWGHTCFLRTIPVEYLFQTCESESGKRRQKKWKRTQSCTSQLLTSVTSVTNAYHAWNACGQGFVSIVKTQHT